MALFDFLSTAATTRLLSKLKTHLAGYLKTSELNQAVDDALAQAKQSGEFDGKDGTNGTNGKDGTSVTVTNVSTSSADGGSNVVTFSDGKTLTVKNGTKGSQGEQGDPYTLTAADKSAIAAEVKASQTTETWTFKLKDGSTVTKTVVIG